MATRKFQRKFQRNTVGPYRDGPRVTLESGWYENVRTHEDKHGNTHESSGRTVWVIRVNGELEDGVFDTWKEAEHEAKRRYPNSDIFLSE